MQKVGSQENIANIGQHTSFKSYHEAEVEPLHSMISKLHAMISNMNPEKLQEYVSAQLNSYQLQIDSAKKEITKLEVRVEELEKKLSAFS